MSVSVSESMVSVSESMVSVSVSSLSVVEPPSQATLPDQGAQEGPVLAIVEVVGLVAAARAALALDEAVLGAAPSHAPSAPSGSLAAARASATQSRDQWGRSRTSPVGSWPPRRCCST